jgi:hypothetical protein
MVGYKLLRLYGGGIFLSICGALVMVMGGRVELNRDGY